MNKLLEETKLINFNNAYIQQLIDEKGWKELDDYNKIVQVYKFVKDDILFGYNKHDYLQASEILKDGYGQCNTKGTLFMTLLRGVGIQCKLQAFYIDKVMQKGLLNGIAYIFAPRKILHTWVDVLYKDQWYSLEGIIIDNHYLESLQTKFSECSGSFCGYGVATTNFKNSKLYFDENDTYIQKEKIINHLGEFSSPDELYQEYNQFKSSVKEFLYVNIVRKMMNRQVSKIRAHK